VKSSNQIVTTNKPTPNFLQAGCPSCCPTDTVRALKETSIAHSMDLLTQSSPRGLPTLPLTAADTLREDCKSSHQHSVTTILFVKTIAQWREMHTTTRLGRSTHLLLARPSRLRTHLLHVVRVVVGPWHRRHVEPAGCRCRTWREHLAHLLALFIVNRQSSRDFKNPLKSLSPF